MNQYVQCQAEKCKGGVKSQTTLITTKKSIQSLMEGKKNWNMKTGWKKARFTGRNNKDLNALMYV